MCATTTWSPAPPPSPASASVPAARSAGIARVHARHIRSGLEASITVDTRVPCARSWVLGSGAKRPQEIACVRLDRHQTLRGFPALPRTPPDDAERTLLAGEAALRPAPTSSLRRCGPRRHPSGGHSRTPAALRHRRRHARRLAYDVARRSSLGLRQLELRCHPAARVAAPVSVPRRGVERRQSVWSGCGSPFQTPPVRRVAYRFSALHRKRPRARPPASLLDCAAGDRRGRGIRQPAWRHAHPACRATTGHHSDV